MAALRGAKYAVDFEGGLIIKGFSTAFIPTKNSQGISQWHCLKNRGGSQLLYKDAIQRCPNRTLLVDLTYEDL
jgi:hypothetical protein